MKKVVYPLYVVIDNSDYTNDDGASSSRGIGRFVSALRSLFRR
jgi:hypothetical protein